MYDYYKLYQNNFKNLPKSHFWATFIGVCAVVIAGAIILGVLAEEFFGAILVLAAGVPLSIGLACLARWSCAVSISQKVVVADTLLAMHGDTASTSEPAKSFTNPSLVAKPKENKLPADKKKCWACGTVQSADRHFCSQCNEKL